MTIQGIFRARDALYLNHSSTKKPAMITKEEYIAIKQAVLLCETRTVEFEGRKVEGSGLNVCFFCPPHACFHRDFARMRPSRRYKTSVCQKDSRIPLVPENFVFSPAKNIRQNGVCLMVDSIPEPTLVRLTPNKRPLFIKFGLFTC